MEKMVRRGCISPCKRFILRYKYGSSRLFRMGSCSFNVLVLFLWIISIYTFVNWSLYDQNGSSTRFQLELQKRIIRLRRENTDEFLIPVLKKYKSVEINLIEKSEEPYNFYDEEIENDLSKIQPDLGQKGEKSSVPANKTELARKIQEIDGFNRFLSDMISPNRSISDLREEQCKGFSYDVRNLPDATVVIIFLEEAYSVLVRAIHSVINRTPPRLLREIILVDDYSSKNNLKGKLERYLATKFPVGKIRLIRLLKSSGLIRARMTGAHFATGDVIVFLDAHIEVGEKWLEPMLERIKDNRRAVVCPNLDVIDRDTLQYYGTPTSHIGGFSWDGNFVWIRAQKFTLEMKTFLKSPTMSGGAFAIDRRYFWEIGSYDSEMMLWGGENLELAFRVWQCGGSVEIIPCSRIGHIYKKKHPYNKPEDEDSFGFNTARLAEVWMDEYKELFYYSYQLEPKRPNIGNITGRLNFRKRLQCKSFKWYLDNIYKGKFMLWKDSAYDGQIRNPATNYCLDNMQAEHFHEYTLGIYPCHTKLYPSQTYFLGRVSDPNSESYLLRGEFMCATSQMGNDNIQMRDCDIFHETWNFKNESIIHERSGKCLTVSLENDKHTVQLKPCNSSSHQKWTINNYGRV